MGLSLGIHVGHDASCALVRDGALCAAIQLERLTGVKHHAVESLWNRLPVREVLACVGASIRDVDIVYTSFQGGAAGGIGLHRALVDPSFDLFDPFGTGHRVLSHHLAHARCAAAYADADELAVLVADYAGSSTKTGEDFDLPFDAWYGDAVGQRGSVRLVTECMSIYSAAPNGHLVLKEREFDVPHPMRESAVCSVASLYENVSRCVFRRANSHGSLMALAAFATGPAESSDADSLPMVEVDAEHRVAFRNDWQHRVFDEGEIRRRENGDGYALTERAAQRLAHRCQHATERATLAYAKRAALLTGHRDIALGGGTFLNILANTGIAESGSFDSVTVPSAPNDAGISVGCAFRGADRIGDRVTPVRSDRLGRRYTRSESECAIAMRRQFLDIAPATLADVAERLLGGQVLARHAGRAEFGPRALGGRSLLASPSRESSRRRLNDIKERQSWRPVAPIVPEGSLAPALDGPDHSPWMTFAHRILPEHREALPAIVHADDTTRAQTLARDEDPWLHDLLVLIGENSGYPILCNTSFNGPGQPIVEAPIQAIDWYLAHDDVDGLVLDERLLGRRSPAEILTGHTLALDDETYMLLGEPDTTGERCCTLRRGGTTRPVSCRYIRHALRYRTHIEVEPCLSSPSSGDAHELASLFSQGFLRPV